jgi:predicted ATP-dependent protease
MAMTGAMGLDGRLHAIKGLFEKVRGAAADGLSAYIVPSGNVRQRVLVEFESESMSVGSAHQGTHVVVEVDKPSRDQVTVYEAASVQDVLELSLMGPGGHLSAMELS